MVRRYLGVAALALLFAGLAEPAFAAGSIPADPWEGFNRRVFAFNDKVDRYFLKPVAKGYRKITPQFLDDGITNMLGNLRGPIVIVNDVLQGKLVQSAQDTGRLLVNSTVGIAGFFDVARHMKMPRHEEDFGQTFARWGVPAGPYVVVPFMFGVTIRDGAGIGAGALMIGEVLENQLEFGWEENAVVLGLDIVDARADVIPMEESLEVQGDRYILIRDAYFQRRAFLVNDGVIEEDPFLDDDASMDEEPLSEEPGSEDPANGAPVTEEPAPDSPAPTDDGAGTGTDAQPEPAADPAATAETAQAGMTPASDEL
ncbi:MAG: MlaA family lipoprotein [Moraxellaceae bacterium]|nr:MlaA family lipoprotein [Moraxellaceae bacterium]